MSLNHLRLDSPLGPLWITADDTHVLAVSMREPGPMVADGRRPLVRPLAAARAQLSAYFAGELREFDLPIRLHGTAFQVAVWEALLTVPYGRVCSYRDIAVRVGRPTAYRATGAAIGRNPVAIIVPCHRVIGASGQLTGYASGLDWKRGLLDLERGAGLLEPGPKAVQTGLLGIETERQVRAGSVG